MFFPWITPVEAALMGAALEQERQMKALQSATQSTGSSLAAKTESIEARISELTQQQAKSNAENAALKQELARLTEALLEQQRIHAEEMKQKVEFDDKLRLYSMQLTSDGLSPIEADRQAREEVTYESELKLASQYAAELLENLSKDFKINEDTRGSLMEFSQVMASARKPKFNPGLLDEQILVSRQLIEEKIWSDIEASRTQNLNFLGDIVTIYGNINKYKESASQGILEALEAKVKAIALRTSFISDLVEMANQLVLLLPITDSKRTLRGVWPASDNPQSYVLETNNVLDFIYCSLSGSHVHWNLLKSNVNKLDASNLFGKDFEKALIGFIVCAMKNRDTRAMINALFAVTKDDNFRTVLQSILSNEKYDNAGTVSHQLTREEKLLIMRIAEESMTATDAQVLSDTYFLLLSFTPNSFPSDALEKLSSKILGIIRTGTKGMSETLLKNLDGHSDPHTVQLIIKSGKAESSSTALHSLEELGPSDDGDLIWALAKVAQSRGEDQSAAELKERALILKSVDAFSELATKAVKTRDLSKIEILESFHVDGQSSAELNKILGARYFLYGLRYVQNRDFWKAEIEFQKAKDHGIQEAQTQLVKLSKLSTGAPESKSSNGPNNTVVNSPEQKSVIRRIVWWMALATIAYAIWKYS